MKNVERIERNETERSERESTVHSFLFISFLCLIPFTTKPKLIKQKRALRLPFIYYFGFFLQD